MSRKLPNVIILIDNENRQSWFSNNYSFGQSRQISTLCRMLTDAERESRKLFKFETFGLFTKSDKLDNFIKTHDGIVICLEYDTFVKHKTQSISRIENILYENKNIPIAIIVEYYNHNNIDSVENDVQLIEKDIIKSSMHKFFIVDVSVMNGVLIKFYNNKSTKSISTDEMVENWLISHFQQKNKKTTNLSSVNISGLRLMDEFYKGTLPIELWDHYGRLRVVWCSLIRFGYDKTINPDGWLCSSWKRYKTSIGHGDKWNYTLTRFWIEILWKIQKTYNYNNFYDLYKNNINIHSGKLFQQYYGNEIFTEKAKNGWIESSKLKNELLNRNSQRIYD
jgi:hypothetical protein